MVGALAELISYKIDDIVKERLAPKPNKKVTDNS
jgi:hypothetical protein